jgi:4-hydroxy-3-methylbut-2-en-1-yl diphosphate synthase IspG/GcpE
MTLNCPACRRRTVDLTLTEEIMLRNLERASVPLSTADMFLGCPANGKSRDVLLGRLRKKLKPIGYGIENVHGQGPWPARYRLERL